MDSEQATYLGHLWLPVKVHVLHAGWVQKVDQMAEDDSVPEGNGEHFNLGIWPIGLVVRRHDLALDQPGHTVAPQVVGHLQLGIVWGGQIICMYI